MQSLDATRISILLATRRRTHLVKRFFDSLIGTASCLDQIEVILYIDDDDPETRAIEDDRLSIRKIIGSRSPMGVMHNKCYNAATGGVIMITGDDNMFRTPAWDERVRAGIGRFEDGICLIYGNDLHQGQKICTSPFLSRRYCELLGGPCPDDYTAEFVDTHILDIFHKLRYWGIDRILYFDDMIIEHMHYVVGKADFDETYAQKAPTDENRERFFRLDPLRVEHAKRLVAHIRNAPSKTKALV